jgi:hypothetical protein
MIRHPQPSALATMTATLDEESARLAIFQHLPCPIFQSSRMIRKRRRALRGSL